MVNKVQYGMENKEREVSWEEVSLDQSALSDEYAFLKLIKLPTWNWQYRTIKVHSTNEDSLKNYTSRYQEVEATTENTVADVAFSIFLNNKKNQQKHEWFIDFKNKLLLVEWDEKLFWPWIINGLATYLDKQNDQNVIDLHAGWIYSPETWLILVGWPRGAGKTTTIMALLTLLKNEHNIDARVVWDDRYSYNTNTHKIYTPDPTLWFTQREKPTTERWFNTLQTATWYESWLRWLEQLIRQNMWEEYEDINDNLIKWKKVTLSTEKLFGKWLETQELFKKQNFRLNTFLLLAPKETHSNILNDLWKSWFLTHIAGHAILSDQESIDQHKKNAEKLENNIVVYDRSEDLNAFLRKQLNSILHPFN